MAEKAKKDDELEYEFEDLRRNTDPIPGSVLEAMGMEADELDLEGKESPKDEEVTGEQPVDQEAGEGEVLDDEGQYDAVKMTKAMRRRLARQRREHQTELQEVRDEGEKRIGKLEVDLADLKAGRATDELDGEFESARSELQKDIENAMEAGDSAKVAELTGKLADVTTEARMKRHQLEQQAAADKERDEPGDLHGDDDAPRIKPKAKLWLTDQSDWWEDSEYSDVRNFVVKVDKKLQAAGYSPDDDDFYTELERIVEKRHPGVITLTDEMYEGEDGEEDLELELDGEDDDIEITPRRRKKRRARTNAPVRSARGRSGRKKIQRKKAKTLSRTRVANMRMFGMDPENPEHVEAYMKEI